VSTSTTWSGQFIRHAKLIVSIDQSVGIVIDSASPSAPALGQLQTIVPGLRFRFEVRASDVETPNTLVARIYNVSDSTANDIWSEATYVDLEAGYENGNKGNIFSGRIKQIVRGRESNVDGYLELRAADGDQAYVNGFINQTFPAGTTDAQELSALAAAMSLPVAKTAENYLTTGGILPRGKTMFGMARAEMAKLASRNDCRWSIQNGVITLVPNTGYLPGQAVAINSATGMIGTPEQTDNGIIVRCLLNPAIKIGQAVKINNRDINQTTLRDVIGFPAYTSQYYPATVTNDGLYRVLVAEHYGDTRGSGNDWYTELTCLAIDPSSPSTTAVMTNG
jgi:hypothetical protein